MGTKLPLMSPCQSDAQCETGLCYPFNAKGPHCTKPCTHDSECPPPADGCPHLFRVIATDTDGNRTILGERMATGIAKDDSGSN